MLALFAILQLLLCCSSFNLHQRASKAISRQFMWPFKSEEQQSYGPSSFVEIAPSWEDLEALLRDKEDPVERKEYDDELLGRGYANHRASIRLFDAPDGFEPEVTLYRDQAAWCPYCEKVWLQLEEKRIPYKVEKAPLRCYGEKTREFLLVSPRGMLPVGIVKGRTISESNDIMSTLESSFPDHNPLLPNQEADLDLYRQVTPLLQLERKSFSIWFSWLTGGRDMSRQMDSVLQEVDDALASNDGPYFLGRMFSLVDIMFAPFLERMAASLPYFKGFESRSNKYPHLLKWYEAMDKRPAYQGIKSDYYTHCHDLPPQIGGCVSTPTSKKYSQEIDGGCWDLQVDPSSMLEPMIPSDKGIATRDAVRRSLGNKEKLVKFACRGVGKRGSPGVSAELADPNAKSGEEYIPAVDSALRLVMLSMLEGTMAVEQRLVEKQDALPIQAISESLKYLRDRIGVPRDMTVHAAQQFRANINWLLTYIASSAV